VNNKYRNSLLPMQYVFLICSSAGCKKYITRRRPFLCLLLIYMRFLTIFYEKPWDRLRLTHFHFEWFSAILRLNTHELLAFVYIFVECTLPRQSSIANLVLYKRQRKLTDVSDRRVMIFLTTYFRPTPMADIKLTSLLINTPIVYSTVRN